MTLINFDSTVLGAYEAPQCKSLEINAEGMMCYSFGAPGAPGDNLRDGGTFDF